MIRINVNPIVEMLSVGVATYREMAALTGLSKSTCFKVMHNPTGKFNEDTALVVTKWYVEYLDVATVETLFHAENLRITGKKPFATTLNQKSHNNRSVICEACFTQTPAHLPECANCDEPLPVLVSA